jgi:hypothetical protein
MRNLVAGHGIADARRLYALSSFEIDSPVDSSFRSSFLNTLMHSSRLDGMSCAPTAFAKPPLPKVRKTRKGPEGNDAGGASPVWVAMDIM